MKQQQMNEGDLVRQAFDRTYLLLDKAAELKVQEMPRTLRQRITTLPPHVKRLMLKQLAALGFLTVICLAAVWAIAAINRANAPTLEQRLAAPYGLEQRPAPTSDVALPAAVGGYEQQQLVLATNEAPRPANCLMVLNTVGQRHPCKLGTLPVIVGHAVYTGEAAGDVVTFSARFESTTAAQNALRDLYQHSRSSGRTGNFAMLSGEPVHYFYSFIGSTVSFVWTHDNRLYSVSGASMNDINQFVQDFPY